MYYLNSPKKQINPTHTVHRGSISTRNQRFFVDHYISPCRTLPVVLSPFLLGQSRESNDES